MPEKFNNREAEGLQNEHNSLESGNVPVSSDAMIKC